MPEFAASVQRQGAPATKRGTLPVEGELVNFSLRICGHMTMWLLCSWNRRCPPESCWRIHRTTARFIRGSRRIERKICAACTQRARNVNREIMRNAEPWFLFLFQLTSDKVSVRLFSGCTCVTPVTLFLRTICSIVALAFLFKIFLLSAFVLCTDDAEHNLREQELQQMCCFVFWHSCVKKCN